ncbi:hypothetical protein AALD74_13630 [Lachnospiraceae bacterium 48-21]
MYWYRKANSSCQLAAFWVTGNSNPQGFGSVAPKSGKEIVVALEISVWEFYKTADAVKEAKQSESKISRRNKLYWYLRRNKAEQVWNDSYGFYGLWTWQSKEVQRKFIHKLYLERLVDQQAENPIG